MKPLTKDCRVCGETKDLSMYHPNKSCKHGVVSTCRDCTGDRRRGWYAANRERRQEDANTRNRSRKLKAVAHFGGVCFDCEGRYPPYVYEFHHLDPTQKDFNPSSAMSMKEDKMWKELEKCVMLCRNCHAERHHGGGK
jgi:hypothetical protein